MPVRLFRLSVPSLSRSRTSTASGSTAFSTLRTRVYLSLPLSPPCSLFVTLSLSYSLTCTHTLCNALIRYHLNLLISLLCPFSHPLTCLHDSSLPPIPLNLIMHLHNPLTCLHKSLHLHILIISSPNNSLPLTLPNLITCLHNPLAYLHLPLTYLHNLLTCFHIPPSCLHNPLIHNPNNSLQLHKPNNPSPSLPPSYTRSPAVKSPLSRLFT